MESHSVPRETASVPKSELEKQQEQTQIAEYRKLVDLVHQKIDERQYTRETFDLTSKLLTINPEYYAIWNARRLLLMHGLFAESSDSSSSSMESSTSTQLPTGTLAETSSSSTATTSTASNTIPQDRDVPIIGKNGTTSDPKQSDFDLIRDDLDFLFPIMVKYPKCYWIWNYRLWLLAQSKLRLTPSTSRDMWMGELVLVSKMLVRDSRNFHGWGYRRKVVSELESPELEGSSMAESEFAYTTKMLSSSKDGLKNFSAWHHRSKLIPKLLDERKADDAARRQFLDAEFEFVTTALYTDSFPYDQSPWFYLQFLMTTLIDPIGYTTINPNFSQADRISYVTKQLENLTEILDGGEDCKWVYSALIEYTSALAKMEERKMSEEEVSNCMAWLKELRTLDPLRSGRWDALEASLTNGSSSEE